MTDNRPSLHTRIWGFLRKSTNEKFRSVRFHLRTLIPRRSTQITLPFGAKWLLKESALDGLLRSGTFENNETRFVRSFLQAGMTVLDVGAHHGYYTLLASLLVGRRGRVFAFEPSPRERIRLKEHICINKRENVFIYETALGATEGHADLFIVEGADDYCNSLRPPAVNAQTRRVSVPVETLDEFVTRNYVNEIDFIKLDVEGAELDVLKGAPHLLAQPQRPVFMIEIYDIRTEPWGYPAREIVRFLSHRGYAWFRLDENGKPVNANPTDNSYDANLVAVPSERMKSFGESVRIHA